MAPYTFINFLLSACALSRLATCAPTPYSNTTYNRIACQSPTKDDPLAKCGPNTILVSPTGPFTTIQSAILSLPDLTTSYTILISPGTYIEQLNITRPGPLTLLGTTPSPSDSSLNLVRVLWRDATAGATNKTSDNAFTSVLTVAPTLNSSLTGSGPTGNPVPADTPFGNADFRAYNIDFVNDFAPYSAGPSLALSVSYANAGFYGCGFYSYQDTIYAGKLSSVYIASSHIAGQTDFLYGFGTLWVTTSLLSLRGCGGGIVAWKGTNTTYANSYGAYIVDSEVRAANDSLRIVGQCALGRPWNAGIRSVFARTYLDSSIRGSGYIPWSATDPRIAANTTMAEYATYGPGFNLTARELASNVTTLLDAQGYEPYSTPERVFEFSFSGGKRGNTGWIDRSAL